MSVQHITRVLHGKKILSFLYPVSTMITEVLKESIGIQTWRNGKFSLAIANEFIHNSYRTKGGSFPPPSGFF